MAADNFTDETGQLATGVWRGQNGSKFVGVTIGLLNDMLAEGASTAWQAGSLYPLFPREEDYKTPLDAIERMARDALMIRYKGENQYTSLRGRARNKWNYWQAGIKPDLISDIFTATGSTATVEVPNDGTITVLPAGYWSAFMLRFALGTHPVVAGGTAALSGMAVAGVDRLGPQGVNTEAGALYLNTIKSVLDRLRPAQWVCWDIVFETTSGHFLRLNSFLRNMSNGFDSLYTYQT